MTEPTTEPEEASDEIRDFTIKQKPHRFKIDGDVFTAPAILSPVILARIGKMYRELGADGIKIESVDGIESALKIIGQIFLNFLPGPSGRRFVARLQSDGTTPDLAAMAAATGLARDEVEKEINDDRYPEDEIIVIPSIDLTRQALPILHWLLERYGMRPTPQSSPLPSDSMTGDSMAGALGTASTGEESTTPSDS